ncbi:MAG: tetratricopeptide repeat protein [Pirellulales bacterium]
MRPSFLRRFWSVNSCAIVAVCSVLCLNAARVDAQIADTPPGTVLDDPIEPLEPARPRSEADADRLHAAALVATARTLEHNGQSAEALRRYQRAVRYDPHSVDILREIVPLAYSLERQAETARYAAMAAERVDSISDPLLLQRLALLLTGSGQWRLAIAAHERLLAVLDEENVAGTVEAVQFRMQLGRLHFLSGSYEPASRHFIAVQKVLDAPEDAGLERRDRAALLADAATTYRLMGESHLLTGHLDEAEEVFRRADRSEPGLLDYQLARVLAARKEHAKALARLEQFISTTPSGEGQAPYELAAELLEKLDREADVLPQLEKWLAADPDNNHLRLFLANRCAEADQHKRAEQLRKEILEVAGDDDSVEGATALDALRGLVELHVAQKQPAPLLDGLQRAVTLAGGVDVVEDEIEPILEDAELLDAVLSHARSLVEANQLESDGALAAAELAVMADRLDDAGPLYDAAASKAPDRAPEAYRQWGLALLFAERYGQAADVLRRGIGDDPPEEAAPLYYHLAMALEMDGHTEDALAAARQAEELAPESLQIAAQTPWIMFHAGRLGEARQAYERLIREYDDRHDSTVERQSLRECRLMLSAIHVVQGDLPAAEACLEEVLDEYPDDIGAMNDLGYLWADQDKHLRRALEMTRAAVAAEPDRVAYLDSLGWALYRLGQFEKALGPLEKAAASEDADGVILDHLGDVYCQLGRIDDARAAWRRAAASFAHDDKQDKLKQVREKLQACSGDAEP